MNTFVTESGPLHHLHRAGYVVAPEMVEAHHAEALRLDRLIDRMDDAFAHWTDIERHGRNAQDSRREAMREFIRTVDEFGGGWAGPVTAMLWAAQRHRNRVERAHAEATAINDRICKTCSGIGVVICPDCPDFGGCYECSSTRSVECQDCFGIDADHADALAMKATVEEGMRVRRLIKATIDARRDELARWGINIFDVESQGYEVLHLMHAEARELNTYRTEAARHLSGVELDRAVSEYARDLAERPRCVACLSVDVHPVDCPFHPAVLEEARANVLARTSQDITPEGLDLYADYLRATAASR